MGEVYLAEHDVRLVGRPPFEGRTVLELLVAHREEQIPALDGPEWGVPSDLASVIARCLEKDAAWETLR